MTVEEWVVEFQDQTGEWVGFDRCDSPESAAFAADECRQLFAAELEIEVRVRVRVATYREGASR